MSEPTTPTKYQRSFEKALNNFKKNLQTIILRFEESDAIFVRRIRMELRDQKFRIAVDLQGNKWVESDIHSGVLQKLKTQLLDQFVHLWIRYRIDRFTVLFDVRHGGVIFEVKDWGLTSMPNSHAFHQAVARVGRNTIDQSLTGYLYDPAEHWNDTQKVQESFKPLSVLLRESQESGSSPQVYVPPEEEN